MELDSPNFVPGPVPLGSKPALHRAVETYTRALQPVEPAKFFEMMAVLYTAFPPQRMTEAEQRARGKLYHKELGDIPHDILEVAFSTVIRTSRYFPVIAEIRAAAEEMLRHRRSRRYRLYQLLHQPERQPDLDPEEDAKVSELLKELAAKMSSRDKRVRDAEKQARHEERLATDPHYAAVQGAVPYRPTPQAIERAQRLGLVAAEAPEQPEHDSWH